MVKNSGKTLKTSVICEGETDKWFLNFLKTNLYQTRQPVCKEHSQVIYGTINLANIKKKIERDCCRAFYFFDKDEIREGMLQKLKDKIKEQGDTWIFFNPQMELCLLAIFEKHHDYKLDKKTLEQKLTKHINNNNIYKDKYDHKPEILQKILLHLKEIVKDDKNDYTLLQFEENLQHYNSNKYLHTNLIEYINHLKMKREN